MNSQSSFGQKMQSQLSLFGIFLFINVQMAAFQASIMWRTPVFGKDLLCLCIEQTQQRHWTQHGSAQHSTGIWTRPNVGQDWIRGTDWGLLELTGSTVEMFSVSLNCDQQRAPSNHCCWSLLLNPRHLIPRDTEGWTFTHPTPSKE